MAVCVRELGSPPFAVRFDGEARVRLVVPGPNAVIEHRTLPDLDD